MNKKAYTMGRHAKLRGDLCTPYEDTEFWTWLTAEDLPLVITISDYVNGWHESDIHAEKRRAEFVVHTNWEFPE
jgi:hypothetical protein